MSDGPSKHFSWEEVRCKHTRDLPELDDAFDDFVLKLEELRRAVGRPLVVLSWYRAASHPDEAVKKAPGPHCTGLAADIRCSGRFAHDLLREALILGFTGIGVSQRGPHEHRFIHLDTTEGPTRPWVWSYAG